MSGVARSLSRGRSTPDAQERASLPVKNSQCGENAPHLVHHLEFIVPIYSWWEGPFYGIGMKIYDRLAGKLGLSPSRVLSREETLQQIPTLEPGGLQRGVSFTTGNSTIQGWPQILPKRFLTSAALQSIICQSFP